MYYINKLSQLDLGRQGENKATTVEIDVSEWLAEYPTVSINILAMRNSDTAPYIAVTSVSNGILRWVITESDTAFSGRGKAEIRATVNDIIKKSAVAVTYVAASLEGTPSPTPPEPSQDWVDEVIAAADSIKNMSATAEVDDNVGTPSVTVTKTKIDDHINLDFDFKNLKGEQGKQGQQGEQGETGQTPNISATASVDQTIGTPSVTVTKSGTDENPNLAFAFSGLKGQDGADGQDGKDGADGKDGKDGEDGITPDISASASVDNTVGTPSVNVTKSGTTAAPQFSFEFHNLKGEKGDDGQITDGEYPNVISGNSHNLISDTKIEEKVPYNNRSAGGNKRVGNYLQEEIVGGTVVFNQLCDKSKFHADITYNGVTRVSNTDDGVIRISGTNTAGNTWRGIQPFANTAVDLIQIGHRYVIIIDNINGIFANSLKLYMNFGTRVWQINKDGIYEAVGANSVPIANFRFEVGADFSVPSDDPIVIRLQMFDLTQMFGSTIADYIYSLETANTGAGVSYFKSLFPNGYYEYNAGTLMSVKTSAHKIYDSESNLVAQYPLDSDLELRGMPKLDSDNNLYYDGDIYQSNGDVTRKYGIVDLGTFTWSYSDTNGFFSTTVADKALGSLNLRCAKYVTGTATGQASIGDKEITSGTGNYKIIVKDSAYTDAELFKTAMSGVYLVYELQTPVTEIATPYTNPQYVDDWGTEEYVDDRDIPIPVGHNSQYSQDLRGKIENMPDIPPYDPTKTQTLKNVNGTLMWVDD